MDHLSGRQRRWHHSWCAGESLSCLWFIYRGIGCSERNHSSRSTFCHPDL